MNRDKKTKRQLISQTKMYVYNRGTQPYGVLISSFGCRIRKFSPTNKPYASSHLLYGFDSLADLWKEIHRIRSLS